jgi:prepilin-type N-terminal cleavage/methylation domain-containing protein
MHFKNKKIINKSQRNSKEGGFTLIEMLFVLIIFAILTAIVVGNYYSYTGNVTLTNMAYEMALSIREAQTYGIAVSNRASNDFDQKYGVNFFVPTGGSSNTYQLYEDKNGNKNFDSGEASLPAYELQRGVTIVGLERDGCNPVRELNILFKRPNPEPEIYANGGIINGARIVLQSQEGSNRRYVVIRNNGQIFVESDSTCPF